MENVFLLTDTMNGISQFVQAHMDVIFFIYGLSFFSLGMAVLFQARKGSDFRIGKYLWLLAAFGLLHGVNEWFDMFLLQPDVWSESGVKAIVISRYLIGKISYVFLFLFGISLLCDRKGFPRVPVFFAGFYAVVVAAFFIQGFYAGFSEDWSAFSDGLIRYFLAFPAALLTAGLFFAERRNPEIRQLNQPSVLYGLAGLGISFSAYAFFVGLVVKPAGFFPASVLNYETFTEFTGIPVQFFRAVCATSMVFFICKVLNIFEYETLHKLDNAYREIIRISNREQMRIGQDLHDDLGQQLTGIAYMNRVLREQLRTGLYAEAGAVLSQIIEQLDRSIDTTRNLSRGLFPVSIEKEGLGFALREFAENTGKVFGAACTVSMEPELKIRSNEQSIQLFRIVQEAVSNAIKHGRAGHIAVEIKKERQTVTLSVEDDGSGIRTDDPGQGGLGLKIMRYRAGVLGGQLDIKPKAGGGTVVVCSFEEPVHEE